MLRANFLFCEQLIDQKILVYTTTQKVGLTVNAVLSIHFFFD